MILFIMKILGCMIVSVKFYRRALGLNDISFDRFRKRGTGYARNAITENTHR